MCGSVLIVRMHMHLVMLAIVPKCFCLFAQRSIECLLGTDEDAKVPEGTMGKQNMVRAAQRLQISLNSVKKVLTNLSERKAQVGFTNNQDRICHGSTHTIFNMLCVRSKLLLKVPKCISSDLIGVWLATLQSLVLGWSDRTLMEGSMLRDDRLWLCNIESSRNCNAMVRTCFGNGAEGVTENAPNVTENVRNVPKDVRKVTKNVRKSDEKASEGRETL